MANKVHAEIEYTDSERGSIHSDICPEYCSSTYLKDKDYRKMLHKCLDEWLDKSNGTGMFYIKGDSFKAEPMTNIKDD